MHGERTEIDGAGRDGRLLSIQYLRGVAATMVVVYHLYSHGILTDVPSAGLHWLKQGVAIFFVISGFVMVHTTADAASRPLDFFARRVLRIAPLYWVATLLWVAWSGSADWSTLGRSLLFVPLVDPRTGAVAPPSLDVGWSLNLEVAFYLLFAAALAAPRRWTVPLASAVFLALAVAEPVLGEAAFALPIRGSALLDFVAGMWIARLGLRLPLWGVPLGFAALALVPLFTEVRVLGVTLPAMLIVAAARSFDRRPVDWPALRRLGDASYAIYLSHMFVVGLAFAMVKSVCGHPSPVGLLALPAALALGLLVHRTIELPLRSLVAWPRAGFGIVRGKRRFA